MRLRNLFVVVLVLAAIAGGSGPAWATVSTETAYVLNSFSFLIHGALVMFMALGFAMLESGLVRTKNTAAICLKNTVLYSLAGIMFYLIGYNLMYLDVPEGGWSGTLSFLRNPSAEELALLNSEQATDEVIAAVTGQGYATMSDWFFQMVFVATAASIISGTLAERLKFWPFMIFVIVLAAVIYPVQGAWIWGNGWLAKLGFSDFAGSTVVHSVGGWCALMGAILLGPRRGKFAKGRQIRPMPGANLPLATAGTFILWFGWFGFNGGSQLALGSAADVSAMAIVYANTNLAAAAGVVAAVIFAQAIYGKIDLTLALNGAIAGLVAITAGPDLQNHLLSIVVGGVGGALVVVAVPLLDRLRIDDVVGAIPAHLVAGIWGTLAVGIFGSGSILTQLIGILAVGAYCLVASAAVWLILKYTIGLRLTQEQEDAGLDQSELGQEAYPEFGRGSQLI